MRRTFSKAKGNLWSAQVLAGGFNELAPLLQDIRDERSNMAKALATVWTFK